MCGMSTASSTGAAHLFASSSRTKDTIARESTNHACYERGIISIIPARRGVHRGFYRRKMRRYNKPRVYYRRERVESVFSVVKRRCGGSARCRKTRNTRAELDFRTIAYNLKVALKKTFSTRPANPQQRTTRLFSKKQEREKCLWFSGLYNEKARCKSVLVLIELIMYTFQS